MNSTLEKWWEFMDDAFPALECGGDNPCVNYKEWYDTWHEPGGCDCLIELPIKLTDAEAMAKLERECPLYRRFIARGEAAENLDPEGESL